MISIPRLIARTDISYETTITTLKALERILKVFRDSSALQQRDYLWYFVNDNSNKIEIVLHQLKLNHILRRLLGTN